MMEASGSMGGSAAPMPEGGALPSVFRLMRRSVLFWVGVGLGASATVMLAVALILGGLAADPAAPAYGSALPEGFAEAAPGGDGGGGGGGGGDAAFVAWILGGFGLLEGGIAAGMIGAARRWARDLRRLGLEGVAIAAEIVEVRVTGVRVNGRPRYRLVWRYLDEAGIAREGTSWLGPRERFRGLEPGQAVEILVDPSDTRRSAWVGDLAV